MASILFLEDHLELIEELVQLLLRARGPETLQMRFATEIADALILLDKEQFDLVVLDVMLPSFHGIPDRDEGCYLAAWLLGKTADLPPDLRQRARPPWLNAKPCCVTLLTSRASVGVHESLVKLIGEETVANVQIIQRNDVAEQRDMLLQILDESCSDNRND